MADGDRPFRENGTQCAPFRIRHTTDDQDRITWVVEEWNPWPLTPGDPAEPGLGYVVISEEPTWDDALRVVVIEWALEEWGLRSGLEVVTDDSPAVEVSIVPVEDEPDRAG